jgi:hypothetical protein
MRTNILLLAAAWTAAPWAGSQNTPSQATDAAAVAAQPAAELRGEVIGVDGEKKTLKLKAQTGGDSPSEIELSVEGEALNSLPALNAGDQVTITCKEETSADNCVVTAVKKSETQ